MRYNLYLFILYLVQYLEYIKGCVGYIVCVLHSRNVNCVSGGEKRRERGRKGWKDVKTIIV